MKLAYAIGALSLLILMGAQGAYAAPQLTVKADNTIYSAGQIVHLSGIYTGSISLFTCLSINVYSGGNLVGFGAIPRSSCKNGQYTGQVNLPSALASKQVTITVRGGGLVASTVVNIGTKASGIFPPTTVLGVIPLSTIEFTLISQGPITGTFSGEYYSTGNVTQTLTGATYVAIDTCTCSYKGGPAMGTTIFYEVGTVTVNAQGVGVLSSVATITSSNLNIIGYLTFSGTTDLTTLQAQGTYTGITSP